MRPAVRQALFASVPKTKAPQLLTVACGNSIAAQAQWNAVGTSAYSTKSELQIANMLSGAPMRFPRITASTRTDRHGVYGYSGQTLATINSDIAAEWFATLDTGGVIPDLVVGLALTENSIAGGATAASIRADLDTWISKVQAKWPAAKILLVTPRVSISYNTAGIVAVYQDIRDYMLSKNNKRSIFVARADAYESTTSPGTPQVTTITGSISTTTLTVTATDGPIGIGTKIFGSGVSTAIVTAYGTGRGGTGTYTVSVSQTVASQTMTVSVCTDETVHPNAAGAVLNARAMKAAFDRIAKSWVSPFTVVANNRTLTGSGAASGTNVTGTVPTSTAVSGAAGGTFVATALQPGFQEAITGVATVTSSNAPVDLTSTNFGSTALSTPTRISPYVTVQLVSGAENLSFIQFLPRVNDGGGNTFQNFITQNTNDAEPTWRNGDILTYVSPPLIANSGSIDATVNFIGAKMKLNQDSAGSLTFRVLEQGVQIAA